MKTTVMRLTRAPTKQQAAKRSHHRQAHERP
jgi:hypothetical protein